MRKIITLLYVQYMQIYVNIKTLKYQEIHCDIFPGECNANEIECKNQYIYIDFNFCVNHLKVYNEL
jgi:hypothetical protein